MHTRRVSAINRVMPFEAISGVPNRGIPIARFTMIAQTERITPTSAQVIKLDR